MPPRSYQQNCGLARALDVLGERWTLLIVRELILGPARFNDLTARLPGIGTNLLADRLRALEAHDIVEKTVLPPPARVPAYQLAARGTALRPMLTELALWGYELIEGDVDQRHTRASWIALSMAAQYEQDPDLELCLLTDFTVDAERLIVAVDGARADVTIGAATHADVVARMDRSTFIELAARRTTARDAQRRGDLALDGDPAGLDGLLRHFHLPD